VPLPNQSFLALSALLEQPGQTVSREALRARLWPDKRVVEFEQGLNAIINRLRDALGDSAGNARFIETLPRRGYRFIAAISAGPVDATISAGPVGVGKPRSRLAGLPRRRAPLSERLRYAVEILVALEHAHGHAILHAI